MAFEISSVFMRQYVYEYFVFDATMSLFSKFVFPQSDTLRISTLNAELITRFIIRNLNQKSMA